MRLVLIQPQLGVGPEHHNLRAVRALLENSAAALGADDVLLLPEHVDATESEEAFVAHVADLARTFGCHVVGGSHHQTRDGGTVNAGAAVAPDGRVVGVYHKLRPYARERQVVRPGAVLGELEMLGRAVLVLICADFWFADLFARARRLPDLVLVPALSVTRKPTPDYSRALWKHMAVSRAYEYGTYVGISDWAYPSKLPVQFTCGVGGFADPTQTDPERLFSPIAASGVAVHALDFDALGAFRRDRVERGFFWKRV
jgi:predicted amidohydrolase